MSASMSEDLKQKYLSGLKKNHHTCTLMDLFCDPEAKDSLRKTSAMDQIVLNSALGQSEDPEWLL